VAVTGITVVAVGISVLVATLGVVLLSAEYSVEAPGTEPAPGHGPDAPDAVGKEVGTH
jgi:hypothetical protein